MSEPSKYAVTLDQLVETVHVPVDDQLEGQDVAAPTGEDESAGYLPGHVRPYGA